MQQPQQAYYAPAPNPQVVQVSKFHLQGLYYMYYILHTPSLGGHSATRGT